MVLFRAFHPTDDSESSAPPFRGVPPASTEPLSVDGRLWPLLRVKFGQEAQASDLERYLEVRAQWLRRAEPHVLVLDVREVRLAQVCASVRQRYIDWLRDHGDTMRRWMVGSAYLLRSPEGRVTTSLIRHGAGMSSPFVVTPSQTEAMVWAAERLREAGLAPAATRVRAAFGIAES